jgi:hypothetical protein
MEIIMTLVERQQSPRFFMAIRLNAFFSIACGLAMVLAAGQIADWLGLERSMDIRVIGIVLVLFAARLFSIHRSGQLPVVEAWSIVAGDLAWVAGSALLLLAYADQFSSLGQTLIAVVAALVLAFAVTQASALRDAFAKPA